MPLTLAWADVACRVALTVLATWAIGFDRDVEGHSVGFENIASRRVGRLSRHAADQLAHEQRWQELRFIGGGAILKRGDNVHSLTTAATLWFVTVVGLCFGSGQMGLGLVGSLLALAILRALKILERKLRRQRVSRLRLKWEIGAYDAASAMSAIRQAGLSVAGFVVKQDAVGRVEELRCSIRRLALPKEHCLPPSVAEAVGRQGVLEWEWTE